MCRLAAGSIELDDGKILPLREVFPTGEFDIQASVIEPGDLPANSIDGHSQLIRYFMAQIDELSPTTVVTIGHKRVTDTFRQYCIQKISVIFLQYRQMQQETVCFFQQRCNTRSSVSCNCQKLFANDTGNTAICLPWYAGIKNARFLFIRNEFLYQEIHPAPATIDI